jgi:hypothetical protein
MTSDSLLQRIQHRPVLPIMFLLFFLLLLGWMNSDYYVLNGRPIVLGDDKGIVAFYDASSMDSASKAGFAYRQSSDGQLWSKEKRVSGRLLDATLNDELLHLLFPTFIASYDRESLKRLKTTTLKQLPFQAAHVHSNKENGLLLFGLDKQQNLRVAKYRGDAIELLDSKLPQATGQVAKQNKELDKPSFTQPIPRIQELESSQRYSVQWSSAPFNEAVYVLLAIAPSTARSPTSSMLKTRKSRDRSGSIDHSNGEPRRLRLLTFRDGQLQSKIIEVKARAVAASLYIQGSELRLLTAATKASQELDVHRFNLKERVFEKFESLPYKRGGLLSNHGVSSLSVAKIAEQRLVLAQIGGSIRLHLETPKKNNWLAMSRLAGETKTLVYGWFTAVLLLSLLLVLAGLQSYRQRRLRWPRAAGGATEEELKHFIESNAKKSQASESQASESQASESQASESQASESQASESQASESKPKDELQQSSKSAGETTEAPQDSKVDIRG